MFQKKTAMTQISFPFMTESKKVRTMEATYKVRIIDCYEGRHQIRPNGFCLLCRNQIEHGNEDSAK